ncbi:MAG: Veg family protein [Clostridia bacterium]|nr:Veg family protein [Clostridia bacterium]
MRKVNSSVLTVIQEIEKLKGENICMEINKGRKRIEKYQGIIENTYPNIFTVNIGDDKNPLSYSYTEVLCGDVVISKIGGENN